MLSNEILYKVLQISSIEESLLKPILLTCLKGVPSELTFTSKPKELFLVVAFIAEK